MLVRRVDVDFLTCPTFHKYSYSDHAIVVARLRLGNRPKMTGHWKLNISLLERRDFRDRLEGLIRRELVGAVVGNKWWASLKFRIKSFAVKYSQRLAKIKARTAKTLELNVSQTVAGGDPLMIELARKDLEHANTERYQGQIVRHRLGKVTNEAVNMGRTLRKEELRRGSDRYIREISTPDGRTLQADRDICEGFRQHYQSLFSALPDLKEEEFRSYLTDFPRLEPYEAECCEGAIEEDEVREALKQVGCYKAPGLDGLPYELYLRMSHLFIPILTTLFNHWFEQGSIPRKMNRGMITLLKKDKRAGGKIDNFRPITLLNTELKILAKILSNRLQIVLGSLIGPEQTCSVKGRSIQDNLHLIRTIIDGVKDDTEAALINLDQSKAFDRVDHRFLAAGFCI